jgi:protein-tyrosine phosphatase
MGNICRSPTAEAAFRRLMEAEAAELAIEVDSAGTHDYHVGEPPDARTIAAARRRGLDLSALRARQLCAADFERFDLVLVMDEQNRRDALRVAPASANSRVRLLLEYAPEAGRPDVPDPYYGGEAGFEHVLDLVESAARGVLAAVREELRGR